MKQGRLRQLLNNYERQIILNALHKFKGSATNVSKYLGIDRRNFVNFVRKNGLCEYLRDIRNINSYTEKK